MRPPNATSRWTTGPKWSSYRRMDMPVARTRRPAVAGYFYAEEPAELAAEVDACLGPRQAIAARGLITPHDSYSRSRRGAGAALGRVAIPRHPLGIGPS